MIRNQNVSPFQHTHAKRLEASFTQILISLLLTFFGSFFSVNLFLVQQVKIFFILSCSSSTKKFRIFWTYFYLNGFFNRNPDCQPNDFVKWFRFITRNVSSKNLDPKCFCKNLKPYQMGPNYTCFGAAGIPANLIL